jgi:ATPase family associated with various cellular activities (AAA)
LLDRAEKSSESENDQPQPPVSVQIPEFVLAEPVSNRLGTTKHWHILDETLEQAPVHRINIAVAIVQAGLNPVLNRSLSAKDTKTDEAQQAKLDPRLWETLTRVEHWNPRDRAPDHVTLQDRYLPAMPPRSRRKLPIIKGEHEDGFGLVVPIEKFGNLIAAEREQIESFNSIRNLLSVYIENKERHDKPISIAVFASPGAGKSFAVKEIAKTFGIAKPLEYNVAQFRTPDDLARALHQVEQEGKKEPPPLVFFDEFDCDLDKQKLGWLKFFLAPMQDGAFYSGSLSMSVEIGRAVFVFAGGVYDSFERFDPRGTPPDEQLGHVLSEAYKHRIEEFKAAKGPDFISRLRGHINVPDANAEPGRRKHFIRRAIQLRGLLEKLNFISNQKKIAKIEEPVIYAFLTVDRYHHGVRSMEAILRMCRPIDDWIRMSSLPAPAQLDMHVDAEEFFVRLHRGRARMDDRLSSELQKRIETLEEGSHDDISAAVAAVAERLAYSSDAPSNVRAIVEALELVRDRPNPALRQKRVL